VKDVFDKLFTNCFKYFLTFNSKKKYKYIIFHLNKKLLQLIKF
jgi:hypothetical protein